MKKLVSFKITALVIAMFACCMTFCACSDDDDLVGIQAEVVLPSDVDLMELEAWSYVVPLEIKSDSEWRIEKNGDFFDVIPSEGEGNATVEIHVTDNIHEERQNGELRIVFPNDESKNMILNLQQKWEGDYDENETVTVGPKKYALGYGYNVMEQYANSESVKGQIFMMNDLYSKRIATCDDSQTNYSMQTITGSTVSEISNQLAANVNVTGKYGKFKGELKSSFTMNHVQNSNYEYAITYLNIGTQTYSFEFGAQEIASKYMTTAAYNAINGLDDYYATDNPEGLKNLVEDYGTHVVLQARLGGRIRHSMEIDISEIKTEYDLEAFASAAYDGVFVQASTDVKNNFKESYKANQSKIRTKVDVIGGSYNPRIELTNNFTKEKVDVWKTTLNSEDVGLIDFTGNGSLLPLYKLVDSKRFPGRMEALKDYMEGEAMAKDFDAYQYQCGTYTKFNVPTFNEKGTLVKDIKLGGEHIGQICEEYIPQLNKDSRVIVIYPVIKGKMCMNMGFFIGDEYHKPSRVSWNGDNVTIEEYPELDFGSVKTLYLRGASIRATANEYVTIKEGNVEDCYLLGNVADINYSKKEVKAKEYKYPLVKIFNHIWTREDYTSPIYDTGSGLSIGYDSNWNDASNGKRLDAYVSSNSNIYVRAAVATNASYAPEGWNIADSKAYNSIKSTLTANNINLPGKTLLEGGLLGYNAKFIGWLDLLYWNSVEILRGGDEQMEYLTSDNLHIRLRKDGTFSVDGGVHPGNWYMRVRLIKE